MNTTPGFYGVFRHSVLANSVLASFRECSLEMAAKSASGRSPARWVRTSGLSALDSWTENCLL